MGNRKKARNPYLRLATSNGRAIVPESGLAMNIMIPNDDKVVVKEVPARVKGTDVGIAEIYEDGTVGIRLDPDAPQWAVDEIKGYTDQLGYSIGKEEPDGSA